MCMFPIEPMAETHQLSAMRTRLANPMNSKCSAPGQAQPVQVSPQSVTDKCACTGEPPGHDEFREETRREAAFIPVAGRHATGGGSSLGRRLAATAGLRPRVRPRTRHVQHHISLNMSMWMSRFSLLKRIPTVLNKDERIRFHML